MYASLAWICNISCLPLINKYVSVFQNNLATQEIKMKDISDSDDSLPNITLYI